MQYEEHQRVYLDEAGINNTDSYGDSWCPQGKRFAAEAGASGLKSASIVLYKALQACVEDAGTILLFVQYQKQLQTVGY
ncbi:hypothetical protein [Halomicronema sp. CCY15110]|uniref:hypothetical protein n=1 Tax=Halomicronema sp. CCY15110 TaxID=2767773 RepID=UPI001950D7A5|nr:hypothetical protein [Halomicronema sp. CCY15110]